MKLDLQKAALMVSTLLFKSFWMEKKPDELISKVIANALNYYYNNK